jgi:hypothetical protein
MSGMGALVFDSAIDVLNADDVVFTKIGPMLNFNNLQGF